jgi:hypothetical protein
VRWSSTVREEMHASWCHSRLSSRVARLLSAIAMAFCCAAANAWAGGGRLAQPDEVEVRGRVVCLPEVMHQLYGTDLAANHPHVWALQSAEGTFYTLLPTKFSEALFVDARVRERELLLKGRVFPQSHVLEVTRTRSIRNGVVQDLFYYCSVCSIETVSPGPCACCQGQVELTERPLRPKKSEDDR